jgi:hypothetical protein
MNVPPIVHVSQGRHNLRRNVGGSGSWQWLPVAVKFFSIGKMKKFGEKWAKFEEKWAKNEEKWAKNGRKMGEK